MNDSAISVNGVPIRIPSERWLHITEEHSEMAGELLAAREIEEGKSVVVVYRESAANDGFVITAFLTRRMKQLQRRQKLWPQ